MYKTQRKTNSCHETVHHTLGSRAGGDSPIKEAIGKVRTIDETRVPNELQPINPLIYM